MNYSELVEETAEKWEIKRTKARELIDRFFESIVEILKKKERLELRGFGVFEVREREGHKGRIPGEGVEVKVPSRRVPAFKASKKIKQALRNLEVPEEMKLDNSD